MDVRLPVVSPSWSRDWIPRQRFADWHPSRQQRSSCSYGTRSVEPRCSSSSNNPCLATPLASDPTEGEFIAIYIVHNFPFAWKLDEQTLKHDQVVYLYNSLSVENLKSTEEKLYSNFIIIRLRISIFFICIFFRWLNSLLISFYFKRILYIFRVVRSNAQKYAVWS